MTLKIKEPITKKGKDLYQWNYLSGITIDENYIISLSSVITKGIPSNRKKGNKKGRRTGEDLPRLIEIWENQENITKTVYRFLSGNEIYQELSNKTIKAIMEEYNFYKLS
jgi:hypothetical protein